MNSNPILEGILKNFDNLSNENKEKIEIKTEDLKIFINSYKEILKNCGLDPLTGLISNGNSIKAFTKFYYKHYEKMKFNKIEECTFAFFTFDADNFTNGNTMYGHYFMDNIITIIGKKIKNNIREDDLGIRLGGEEFGVVCKIDNIETAANKANKIRKEIEACKVDKYVQTISGGIYLFKITKQNFEDLNKLINKYKISFKKCTSSKERLKINKRKEKDVLDFILPQFIKAREASDNALYKAKYLGKNQICIYNETEDYTIYRSYYNTR